MNYKCIAEGEMRYKCDQSPPTKRRCGDCMYIVEVPNVPKKGESKHTKRAKKESTQAKNGRKQKQSSSKNTLSVAVVEVKVKYPITLTMTCTEDQNTLIYPVQCPTVTTVIPVSIPVVSNVRLAAKLWRSQKVSDALDALKSALRSELNTTESTGKGNETKQTKQGEKSMFRIKRSGTANG